MELDQSTQHTRAVSTGPAEPLQESLQLFD